MGGARCLRSVACAVRTGLFVPSAQPLSWHRLSEGGLARCWAGLPHKGPGGRPPGFARQALALTRPNPGKPCSVHRFTGVAG